MIAANDEYLTEAAETIYQLNADKYVLKLCQDREEYYNDLRCYNKTIAEQGEKIVKDEKTIAEQDKKLAENEKSLAEKDDIISRLLAEIELLKSGK